MSDCHLHHNWNPSKFLMVVIIVLCWVIQCPETPSEATHSDSYPWHFPILVFKCACYYNSNVGGSGPSIWPNQANLCSIHKWVCMLYMTARVLFCVDLLVMPSESLVESSVLFSALPRCMWGPIGGSFPLVSSIHQKGNMFFVLDWYFSK